MPLIPASDWRLLESQALDAGPVAGFDFDPAVEREYGTHKRELRQYQLGTRRVEVLREEASDPAAAYGLLTFYRTAELSPQQGLELAFIGPSTALMARGPLLIRVRALENSAVARQEFAGLLILMGGTRPSRAEMEDLPPPLPAAGLIPHSEKFILGLETARRALPDFPTDLIGFAQGAELRMADYSTSSGKGTLLSIHYPTPQIARIRYGALESMLELNRERSGAPIYGKRGGSFVFLVLHSDAKGAENILKQFRVTSDVSWNEPKPEPERFAADLARMILSIIFLVLVIAAIAVVTGALMAGSRRVARRFFPDSAWANPEREKVIRLNLQ